MLEKVLGSILQDLAVFLFKEEGAGLELGILS